MSKTIASLIGITLAVFTYALQSSESKDSKNGPEINELILETFTSSEKMNEAHTISTYRMSEDDLCSIEYSDCLQSEDILISGLSDVERAALNLFTEKISPAEEEQIGKEFHEKNYYDYVNDERTEKLQLILEKIKPHVSRSEVNYRIYLIEDAVVNAWTVPGGGIYFTTGMYESIQSDDEIANIIGHEVGHNECKHPHRFLKREKGVKSILDPLGGILGMGRDTQLSTVFTGIMSIPLVSFGQPDELTADRTGFYLANKAGYDPEKGLEFWKRLSEQENVQFIEKFTRSHPYSSARYDCGKKYLDDSRQ